LGGFAELTMFSRFCAKHMKMDVVILLMKFGGLSFVVEDCWSDRIISKKELSLMLLSLSTQ
jgi:hypothetical protein